MDINTALPDPNAYNPYINEMIVDQMNRVNVDVSTRVSDDIIAPGIMRPVNSALQDGCFPSAVPDVNGYNPYMNEMIVDKMKGVNFGVLPKVSDEMTGFNVMGPPISAPLETKDTSVVNTPVCQHISAPQEASVPSLVYPPTPQVTTGATFMPPRVSPAEEISVPSLVYPPISAGQGANTPSLVLPPISIAHETGALPLLSPPIVPTMAAPRAATLPNPYVTAPQKTTATLLYPSILAQEETRPPSFPQATVAHLHQCTGRNAEAFHVNEENRRTPYMIPLVSQSIMGVPHMPCDTAPTGAMPECQYVTPEACGSTWRLCHLARPETMAGMPTAVAFPGGSRIVIGCGQDYNPDQTNLPMYQNFGPCFSSHHVYMGGASSFQTICPMSGAYMPVMPTAPTFEPSDHRCYQGSPDVIPPHYVRINSPTHSVASYPCPTPSSPHYVRINSPTHSVASYPCPIPSSMQPQGFAYAPVHMYGTRSETGNAMSSTFN
ncbi:unnamed protein product, partial [Coregonus sp. 'balchen']